MPLRELTLGESLQRFVRKWAGLINDGLTERMAAQDFLRDLLETYDVEYTPGRIFEQHPFRVVKPVNGELFESARVEYTSDFMDLYLPDICVWEMKGPKEKLEKHHKQVLGYWAVQQTRYMVLCNFREIWVYDTSVEGGQNSPAFKLELKELPANPEALIFLRGEEPHVELHSEQITRKVASYLGDVVRTLIDQSDDPERERPRVTKFAMECVFAMFAEDSDLIPPGVFTVAMDKAQKTGDMSPVYSLFGDFDREDPRDKQNPGVPYINGTLYDSKHPKLKLDKSLLASLHVAARNYDWQAVRPEVFGSIFEQALARDKRHELGAHFTAREDIMKVVGPTVIRPWQQRIKVAKTHKECEALIERMKRYHVLDPACGCGNFLYVVYREMKRLEAMLRTKHKELFMNKVARRKSDYHGAPPGPYFKITQLHGIDIQDWAVTLTRVVLWIAEHLADRELALNEENLPLKPLDDNIVKADALFADWFRPEDDGVSELAIVGNPPFLGAKKMRTELGDEYVDRLHSAYPRHKTADLITYWYPNALRTLQDGERFGFVSPKQVSKGQNKKVSLDLIFECGGLIIDAWKAFSWPGEASVSVIIVNSILGEYDGIFVLDGSEQLLIRSNLESNLHEKTTRPNTINPNGLSYMGVTVGDIEFEITSEVRRKIISTCPVSKDVIKPFMSGKDLNRLVDLEPVRWIIDFDTKSHEDAQKYTGAFLYVRKHVYPVKMASRKSKEEKARWWQFKGQGVKLREALAECSSYLATAVNSPYVIMALLPSEVIPDKKLIVFPFEDYYHFGILQSTVHAAWVIEYGGSLEERIAYTHTSIVPTFPFPLLDSSDPFSSATAPGCADDGDAKQGTGDACIAPTDNYNPRVVPKTPEAKLVGKVAKKLYSKRQAACITLNLGLTKLYNYIKGKTELGGLTAKHQKLIIELQGLHEHLNDAVTTCYGWPKDAWRDENEVLRRLLELNLSLTENH